MKSYTDLEQSKKLAEILSIESADNYYSWHDERYYIVNKDCPYPYSLKEKIPCWSLTALLGVLPFHLIVNNQRYAFSMHKGLNKNGETYMFRYNIFNTDICLYETEYYNSPIDACVAIIEKLKELNLL